VDHTCSGDASVWSCRARECGTFYASAACIVSIRGRNMGHVGGGKEVHRGHGGTKKRRRHNLPALPAAVAPRVVASAAVATVTKAAETVLLLQRSLFAEAVVGAEAARGGGGPPPAAPHGPPKTAWSCSRARSSKKGTRR